MIKVRQLDALEEEQRSDQERGGGVGISNNYGIFDNKKKTLTAINFNYREIMNDLSSIDQQDQQSSGTGYARFASSITPAQNNLIADLESKSAKAGASSAQQLFEGGSEENAHKAASEH